MDQKVYELGRNQYRAAAGLDDMPRDKDGFIVLKPTASRVDKQVARMTTSIDDLESKLDMLRKKKAAAEKYQKTEEYKESKKEESKKKKKKRRNALMASVFNSAEMSEPDPDAEADEANYHDIKGSKKGQKGRPKTTLETQYGKRYAPLVSMLYESIDRFDQIAKDIDEELKSPKGQVRNMYRSTQIGNLLSAEDKKVKLINDITKIADKVTDIEYRERKESKEKDSGDDSKMISHLGARFLKGMLDDDDDDDRKGKKKKKRSASNFDRSSKKKKDDSDDLDDDDEETVKKKKKSSDADDDESLSKALADELINRKKDLGFTEYEKNLDLEGKFNVVVAVDPLDLDDWKFMAVDKNGKELKGDIKDRARKLLPKRSNTKMRIDINKKKAYDARSGRNYRLVFTK